MVPMHQLQKLQPELTLALVLRGVRSLGQVNNAENDEGKCSAKCDYQQQLA